MVTPLYDKNQSSGETFCSKPIQHGLTRSCECKEKTPENKEKYIKATVRSPDAWSNTAISKSPNFWEVPPRYCVGETRQHTEKTECKDLSWRCHKHWEWGSWGAGGGRERSSVVKCTGCLSKAHGFDSKHPMLMAANNCLSL